MEELEGGDEMQSSWSSPSMEIAEQELELIRRRTAEA
jgi:hypothetical protein